DGEFNLQGQDVAVGYNLGVLLEPRPGTRIGLTYRSRIQHELDGQATFNVPTPLNASPAFQSGPAHATLVLPDTAALSLTQELGRRWAVYLDLMWTDWSVFKTLSAFRSTGELITSSVQNYRNSFTVALGASYELGEKLTLRAGTAWEGSPVQEAFRDPRVPDNNRYLLSVGATYRISPRCALDVAYAHVFVPNASVLDRSSTGDVLQGQFSSISSNILAGGMRLSF
ncbi:MAG: outer membrane protein transport protein, partial [Acetobacteraceae bacterium]|nr:outer membrane protein transport protein [Acetobacteraceae bacterium]